MTKKHPEAPTPRQLAELREEIERSLIRLRRSVKQAAAAEKPIALDQTTVGRLSRMDALQNQHFNQGLQEREAANLVQMEEALRRLDEGSYGICADCAEPIPFPRLQVFPETLHCTSCPSAV
jgi:DnaK suppressor protein